jgi:cell division protein FtsB
MKSAGQVKEYQKSKKEEEKIDTEIEKLKKQLNEKK